MNRERVDKIARTLLYEGYVLYPYRPSVKNSQRWSFGCVHPCAWNEQNPFDAATMRTECLVSGRAPKVQITVRFLHLLNRKVGKLSAPAAELSAGGADYAFVSSMDVDDRQFRPWQEAVEREVDLGVLDLSDTPEQAMRHSMIFDANRTIEPVRSGDSIVAVLIRDQQQINGTIDVSWEVIGQDLRRLKIEITNTTELTAEISATRDEALLRTFVSTHTILGASDGEFISLTDPLEALRAETSLCKNVGTWPILIGEGNEHDTLLSSPIILCDYPELAPESPGDLFDATEIDEILTLRILTLTDEEKRIAAATDDRVRQLLERTESLARDQLMSLHGSVRGLRPTRESIQDLQPAPG